MKYRMKRHAVVQPLDESYRLIPLTQGQNAIVDTEDFDRLSKFNWHARWYAKAKAGTFYAARWGNGKTIFMHQEILGHKHTDHRKQNTLDNRKKNLRECTIQQNNCNQRIRKDNVSGFKGVFKAKRKKRWECGIRVNGKRKHLGYFDTKEDAAKAYDRAALEYFGEFAHLNYPCSTL